ncbi:hypothetical protein GOP47_0018085 [Adiantum capillus-veneris]|uniref:Aminotransferase class V domain-containing protein n=1 Tax=Adiantum capillus-veneris TaxID=13818 RepID=A0A9D4UH39_ADICA|nr:hypothetical protein GOP47_0018085 [Adiantum capillus-veneris]
MFNKLTKLRHKHGGSQKNKENAHLRLDGIAPYSFDNCSVSSQSSSRFSSETGRVPSDGFASYAETTYSESSPNQWVSSKGSSDEVLNIGDSHLPCYAEAEEKFLEDFEDYFEHLHVDNIRKEQYPKLDLQRMVYLDHANSALFSQYQVEQHMRVLLEEGPNLGSVSLANALSSNLTPYVLDTLQNLLRLFNVSNSDYGVVFTTGFTAGYRLFSEIYPFRKGTTLLTLQDNHESVKHVISAAEQHGGKCLVVPLKETDLSISASELRRLLRRQPSHGEGGRLFVYPAQSCLSGMQHSLNWIPEVQQFGSHVLLDVSTHLPIGPLDLSVYHPEFVLGSLHHMLGYPSGMGFLLVRKKAFSVHRVSQSLRLKDVPDEGNDCHIVCEDDSINLLAFAALSFGLQHLESVGLASIHKRVLSLMNWLIQMLKSLRHKGDERPLLQLYGSQSAKSRGNIVAFNVVDSTGNCVPASLVQKLADRSNIIIGAGYFSNPGLAAVLQGGNDGALDSSIFRETVSFSSLRVSLGSVSTFSDVYRLVQFLCRFRDEDYLSFEALDFIEDHSL